jgi:hypothetical protein
MSRGVTLVGRGIVAVLVLFGAAVGVAKAADRFTDDSRSADLDNGEQKARLANAILQRAEAAAERELDPGFRRAALARLTALPAEELEQREASGSLGALTLGASRSQLAYTPITPCRIIDTRRAGGTLPVSAARDFRVTGSGHQMQGGEWPGCGVPFGPSTAAVIAFTVVNPVGPGYLRIWEYRYPFVAPPSVSLLSYNSMSPSLPISNTIVTAICDLTTAGEHGCPHDFRVQAEGSGAHLIADVVGYFERVPREQARSFSVAASHPESFQWSVPSSCASVPGAALTLDAPVAGTVVVRGVIRSELQHTPGAADALRFGISQAAYDCSFPTLSGAVVASALPGDVYVSSDDVLASFPVAAGVQQFSLNAVMTSGASSFDRITGWSLEATFHPN